jgi:hypothetical protein
MRPVHRAIARFTAAALACGALGLAAARPAAAQVSVSGVVYAQYSYNASSDTLTADSAIAHINNFDITRAYVNVNGRFAGGITTRVTTDIFLNNAIAGSRLVRLKYAFATWTPDSSALTFKLGQMQTPYVDYEEALWDYRMQGTIAVDRNGYMSSSDFGLAVDGKWNNDAFNFSAGIFNGENYNGALGDNRKDLMARASIRLMGTNDGSRVGGLRLTGYGQIGMPSSGGQRNRFIGLLSYRSQNITLGAEYVATTDSVNGGPTAPGNGGVVAASAQRKGTIISAFGVFHFPETRFSLVGRMDVLNPNTNLTDSTRAAKGTPTQTRIIAGVSYQLTPNVRLLADVDRVSYESTYFKPSVAQQAAQTTANLHAQFTF